jgi:hypothetical protein
MINFEVQHRTTALKRLGLVEGGMMHFARRCHERSHDHGHLKSLLRPVGVAATSLKAALVEIARVEKF